MVRREMLWDSIEEESYTSLPLREGMQLDPFEAERINAILNPAGHAYSAGIGRHGKPHFSLGELVRREEREGLTILVTGEEYARDLATVPAASREGVIYLRQDAMRRWLWEKVDLWRSGHQKGALENALLAYGFSTDADAEATLEAMLEAESETLILHEIGEQRAHGLLGSGWAEALLACSSRRQEITARAARDNLADCLVTLPVLLERQAWPSLHFYFANFDGMRRELFPALPDAYRSWLRTGTTTMLQQALEQGQAHWPKVISQVWEKNNEPEKLRLAG
jgi:hypothetical protein